MVNISQVKKGTLVGFGLGAIQSGLFLYEAQVSGNFERFVIAEVVPEIIKSVRRNAGLININIAHQDRIETVTVGPLEVLDPNQENERQVIIKAIAGAEAITTALPGVNFYQHGNGDSAPFKILAAGLDEKIRKNGPQALVYTAENHNHAAEILQELVLNETSSEKSLVLDNACFLNTVIGKMSGVIHDAEERNALKLKAMTPEIPRAILVEAFNRILISRVSFEASGFLPKIQTFTEKDDLLPFEEAKLYGHNATHALAAYLGSLLGIERIAELADIPGMMEFLRNAFMQESGVALIHRYEGIDPLFTPEGYQEYVDDLLLRMVNPYLSDRVERVGRDVERKLAWDDRLVGTMRLCLAEGIQPLRYALGTAAALCHMDPDVLSDTALVEEKLTTLWGEHSAEPLASGMIKLVNNALKDIKEWQDGGSRDPLNLLIKFDMQD